MKAEHLVLMGHSLGAVQSQLYLSHGPGVGKFDALILTGSALLRKYRNSSASDFRRFSGAGEAFLVLRVFVEICQLRCHHLELDDLSD